jgi:hypothetical protein
MSVRLRITAAMKEIVDEQQMELPPLTDDSLHETGFDSRAFAILAAHPTVGDFVLACENVPA